MSDILIGATILILFIPAILIISIWYSLTFFVIINEEEFYVDAIAKSRKYIKNKFFNYVSRLMVLNVICCVILGLFLLIIYFMGVPFINILLIQSIDIPSLISDKNNIIIIAISIFFIFFLMVWSTIFYQLLYEDFAMEGKYVNSKLSKKHQNLFFILLIMTPFVMDQEASLSQEKPFFPSHESFNNDADKGWIIENKKGLKQQLEDFLNKVLKQNIE
jgi:hypothetical protein